MQSIKKALGAAAAVTASVAMLAGGAPVALAADVTGDIPIDETYFPEDGFRTCIEEPQNGDPIDADEDGRLSVTERNAVTIISCTYAEGNDLSQVLQWFPNLEELQIPRPSAIDVSHNPKLVSLEVSGVAGVGGFDSIDLSHNPQLKKLDLSDNELTTLDVSHNSKLTEMYLDGNQLTSLDLSHNPALETLWVQDNQLTTLNMPNNPKLTQLNADGNAITSIDVTHSPSLVDIDLRDSPLTSIDVSKNPKLESLDLNATHLTSLDVSKNPKLAFLDAGINKLSQLDVAKNTKLEYLDASHNELQSFTAPQSSAFTTLDVSGNKLTSLDVSRSAALARLNASDNALSSLDVSHNAALRSLYVANNKLRSLDTTRNTNLYVLQAENNSLTALDLSKNETLAGASSSRSAAEASGAYVDGNPLVALKLPTAYQGALGQTSGIKPAVYQATYAGSTFDLSSVASWFDGAKVSEVKGATLNGTKLTGLSGTKDVTYTYATGAAAMPLKAHLKLIAKAVPDTTAPVLSGVDDVSVEYGAKFDPRAGVSARDAVDGDVTSRIVVSGSVDTSKSGSYTLTYVVSDKAGNKATVRRKVTVKAQPSKPSEPSAKVSFEDVSASTPHADDIKWLASAGISTGWKRADGSFEFRGMSSVKRQDMAAFLYRLAGSPSFDESKVRNPFKDVTSKTPHYKEIMWLYSTGISTGWRLSDGSFEFRGMNSVVRQDMAAFLRRLADYEKAKPTLGKGVSFKDVTSSTPHSADIAWLARTGVTTGWKESDGSTTFRGMSSVKRQDMAAFLHRMKLNVLK
ncbi:T9SS C-terminal target domain-containing protein [Bifidobacterium ramosum]|nr:immunoglobulin-like domain-containing protein [Bifidobacterium ramosum]KAB8288616.1 T9SS C-terminal target domain-containing protein [Bifidobacterium ramosum]